MSDTPKKLPPGRELDALVAEKVMGWTVNRTGDRHWHTVGDTGRDRNIQIGSDCCAGQWYDSRAFCPSQDIRAAWEVVEKMHALNFTSLLHGGKHVGGYARFMTVDIQCSVPGETAPHAICLAALRTLERLAEEKPQ